MPKIRREVLEGMSPVHGGMSYGRASVEVPMGQESVLIASPALALACLTAREIIRGRPTLQSLRECGEELDAALETAGVEVES